MVRLLRDSCEQVAKRLNPHTKGDKQHIKCCDTCLQCKGRLIIEGWTARHDDNPCRGETPFGVAYAANSGEWYKLCDHRATKLHTRSRPPLPLEPTGAEREAWSNLLVDRSSAKNEAQLADARRIELTACHNFFVPAELMAPGEISCTSDPQLEALQSALHLQCYDHLLAVIGIAQLVTPKGY